VVNVSLDHIRGSLSAGVDEATWAITSYMVANAIILPIAGWLSRVFGRKMYLLSSLGLFTLSSLLCGSAWSLQSLVVFRVLQGLAGGGLVPLAQSILLETFPPRQHGVAMAFYGVGIMFGPIVGPVLGGWITDTWSWHWIFFINIPIGLFALILTSVVIHDPPYMKRTKMPIDYVGLALISIGIGCLQFVLDKGEREDWFSSTLILYLTIIAACALILFVLVELKVKAPVVNLRTFKNLSFAGGNAVMFATFFVMFSFIVLVPLYLQGLMGYSATLAGLALAPGGLATLVVLQIAGVLSNKVHPRVMIFVGMVIMIYAVYDMSHFNLSASFSSILWPRVVVGVGMGFVFVPLNSASLSTLRKEEMPNGVAIFNLLRNLGGSFGVAFSTTVLSRQAQVHQSHLVEHLTPFNDAYLVALQHGHALLRHAGITDAMSEKVALGALYRELMRQTGMLSFNDTFYFLSILMTCTLPFVLFLKRGKAPADAGPTH
jgi:MFS transporter, DHA2 family, multidrug resistance protein